MTNTLSDKEINAKYDAGNNLGQGYAVAGVVTSNWTAISDPNPAAYREHIAEAWWQLDNWIIEQERLIGGVTGRGDDRVTWYLYCSGCDAPGCPCDQSSGQMYDSLASAQAVSR